MWTRLEKQMKHYVKIEKNNTHLFFQTKDQWRRRRNEDVITLWDFPFQGDECLPKAILMENIFACFAALDGVRLLEFENDPQEDEGKSNF